MKLVYSVFFLLFVSVKASATVSQTTTHENSHGSASIAVVDDSIVAVFKSRSNPGLNIVTSTRHGTIETRFQSGSFYKIIAGTGDFQQYNSETKKTTFGNLRSPIEWDLPLQEKLAYEDYLSYHNESENYFLELKNNEEKVIPKLDPAPVIQELKGPSVTNGEPLPCRDENFELTNMPYDGHKTWESCVASAGLGTLAAYGGTLIACGRANFEACLAGLGASGVSVSNYYAQSSKCNNSYAQTVNRYENCMEDYYYGSGGYGGSGSSNGSPIGSGSGSSSGGASSGPTMGGVIRATGEYCYREFDNQPPVWVDCP